MPTTPQRQKATAGQRRCGQDVGGKLVVAGGDAADILQATEHRLGGPTPSVSGG